MDWFSLKINALFLLYDVSLDPKWILISGPHSAIKYREKFKPAFMSYACNQFETVPFLAKSVSP